MLKKIRIEKNGDSEFLPGTNVDVLEFEDVNEVLEAEGKEPATGEHRDHAWYYQGIPCNKFLLVSCILPGDYTRF